MFKDDRDWNETIHLPVEREAKNKIDAVNKYLKGSEKITAKLWEEENWLVFVHLLMPIVIGLTIQFHSFGLWQKSLIAYFVVLINMHDLLRLCEHETKPVPRPGRISVSELAREFYESGHYNPLQRQVEDSSGEQKR